MAELIFDRSTVILLALGGAALVLAATFLRQRLGERCSRGLNRAGYALTLLSVLVFIVAGYRSLT